MKRTPKAYFNCRVPSSFGERVKATARARGMSQAHLLEQALRAYVARLERLHNQGRPFPQLPGSLPDLDLG